MIIGNNQIGSMNIWIQELVVPFITCLITEAQDAIVIKRTHRKITTSK